MEKFACKNLGLDCDFVATGASREELMKKVMEHGGTVHAALMVGMTKEQSAEFAKKLEATIQAA